MGLSNGLSRQKSSPTSSVMLRKCRRLRVTAIFYSCGGLCAILLLVNYNEDVKRLLQQSPHPNLSGSHHNQLTGPHAQPQRQNAFSNQHSSQSDYKGSSGKGDGGEETGHTLESPGLGDGDHPHANTDDDVITGEEGTSLASPMGSSGGDSEKAWYMTGGMKFPTIPGEEAIRLWSEENLNSDRILDQLMYWIDEPINHPNFSQAWEDVTANSLTIPTASPLLAKTSKGKGGSEKEDDLPDAQVPSGWRNETGKRNFRYTKSNSHRKMRVKTILLYYGLGMSWGPHVTPGRSLFLQQKCPVNACRLTGNRSHMAKADVVLFKDVFMNPKVRRNPNQLWAMYMLECPLNTQNFVDKNVFNLTATYRHDSDIVTPYEKWVYHDETVKTLKQGVNYAEGKSKKVAWFVSNCVAKNNRLDYARELSKYIEVDIYGACGTHSCSRANAKQCFDLLAKNYKFYLAFENSNCRDYISEKFFVNGLGNNVLPIVMGAHPDDYKRVAPEKSYIHVDDFATPKELAEYLYLLDSNNELYNEYFQWKGTGEFINTHFFCRLCAMAHYTDKTRVSSRYYKDFNKWWRGPNVCTRRSWRNQPDIFSPEYYDRPVN